MKEIKNISYKEKIAQLIFPRLDLDKFDENYDEYKKLTELGVGGFCLFGVNADIVKIRDVVTKLQSIAKIPLLICADLEHGLNMRFKAGTSMPRAEAVGNTNNPQNARIIGEMIAKEALSCGILWNLAPVCDVNSNPNNPIIFLRSFGYKVDKVVAMSSNYIIGTQAVNVVACAKHFPGHGDTNEDSHVSVPIINKSLDELTKVELLPFYTAIRSGVVSIMVGHLIVPALDATNTPASISYSIITEFLKQKLGYKGLIVTDALDMKSMHKEYKHDSLAYLSLKAGADVLLMPMSPFDSYKYIIEKFDKDIELRIQESFEKIKQVKEKLNLFDEQTYPTFDNDLHHETALSIASQGLATKGDNSFLPIKDDESFLYIGVLVADEDLSVQFDFHNLLSKMTINDCDTVFINESFDELDAKNISEVAEKNDFVIITMIQGPKAYRSREKLSEALISKINQIAEKSKSICMSFGAKDLSDGIKTDFYINTTSDTLASFTSACSLLTGSNEFFNYVNEVSKLNTD